jgi:hypothetical protein
MHGEPGDRHGIGASDLTKRLRRGPHLPLAGAGARLTRGVVIVPLVVRRQRGSGSGAGEECDFALRVCPSVAEKAVDLVECRPQGFDLATDQ